MSGSGGASGYEYQAQISAYASCFALAGQPLNFGAGVYGIPVAIRLETGEGGDDLRITMATGEIVDVQAKHHAELGEKFLKSVVRLLATLTRDPALRGVLLVDTVSSGSIREEFAIDAERLGRGLNDGLRNVAQRVLDELKKSGIAVPSDAWSRFAVRTLDLGDGAMGQQLALDLLRRVLRHPEHAPAAWERLVARGLNETVLRGVTDVPRLVAFLRPAMPVGNDDSTAAGAFVKYRDWATANYATFPVIGFRSITLPSSLAWDEAQIVVPGETALPQTPDEELARYHAPEEGAFENLVETDDLLLMEADAVIVGAAGGGKSAWSRRLVVDALGEGMIAMRVPLTRLMARLNAERTIDEAIRDVALDGSGIVNAASVVPALLIADGLDECGDRRAEIAEGLLHWRRGHPRSRLIVTTRSFGHSPAHLPDLLHVDLQALNRGAIARIATQIFERHFGDATKASEAVDRFDDALDTNAAAALAARTPLLLGCLAAVFVQGRDLPSRRAALFRAVVELLRDQPIHGAARSVNHAVADRVMEIAGSLLVENRLLGRSQFRDAIGTQLHRDGLAQSPVAGRALAADAIEFWEQRRLFERLTTGALEIETFVHLNLAEYAAGRYAVALSVEGIEAWVRASHTDSRWRESILFAAGEGAVEPIVRVLLDVDEPVFAEEAIVEADDVPPHVVETTVRALAARLSDRDVHVVVPAADALILLHDLAPSLLSDVALPLLEHEEPLTRLAAETIVFAGDAERIPEGMPRRWLEAYLPVPGLINLPKSLRPKARLDLPQGARDLNNRGVELAMDALFRIAPHADAMEVAEAFLRRFKLPFVHVAAERVFQRHGRDEEFRALREELSPAVFPSFFSRDVEEDKATILALLDAIAATVGKPPAASTVQHERWRMISRILSAIRFVELEPVIPNSSLGKRVDHDSLEFIIDRTILALGLDHDVLREELASAYAAVEKLTMRGIYPWVRTNLRMRIDWSLGAQSLDPERLEQALRHPSACVRWVAEQLRDHSPSEHPRLC